MLQPLGQKLYFQLCRIKSKWQPPHYINIGKELQQARHILLCLPSDSQGHQYAQGQLSEFRKIFRDARLTILHDARHTIQNIPRLCHVISYGEQEFNAFGLPKKAVLNSIFDSKVDLFFDLNRHKNNHATLFACYSKAKLRIGFDHEHSHFYNFVIRFQAPQGWREAFSILFKYVLGIQCRLEHVVAEDS
ncbi:hypothetical protein GF406_16640 [candidate division KSB1 bacterium]|jgi:hypothetical protein|nr:hypothetical protein [candidate division KSB1 bacterium]